MSDERVLVASQSLAAPVPTPEPDATTSAAPEPGSPLPSDPIVRPEIEVSGIPVRRFNYIARHWRGDLSLPVSYWINDFVATIAVSVFFRNVRTFISLSDGPVVYAATITLISLVVIAVSVWQFVGIWRSAGKHRARGGTRFWAWAARFAVFAGFLGFAWTLSQQDLPKLKEFWCIAAGDPCVGTHALHVLRGGTELELVGGITFGLTKEVKKLLEANPKIQVIRLKGPGGRIGEAHELRKLIDERGLVTYVGSTCASACTIAFLGGSRRYLAPGARLGFHRGTFPGATVGELDRENNADRRWLIGMGVPRWFADRAYSTPNDDIWWPTPHELWQAGVITDITGGHAALAFHDLTAAATKGDIDEELQKTSLYVAIKRAEPDTYHRILVAIGDAIRSGRSKAELAAVARPFIYGILQKYQAHASDEVVISFGELFVAEIDEIEHLDMDACYVLLFPKAAIRPTDLTEYLSFPTLEREFATVSELVETAATHPQNIPVKKEVSQLEKIVAERLAQRYSPEDLLALAHPQSSKYSHGTVCKMFRARFEEILSLPVRDRAQLLRFLFASGWDN